MKQSINQWNKKRNTTTTTTTTTTISITTTTTTTHKPGVLRQGGQATETNKKGDANFHFWRASEQKKIFK